MKAIVTGASKGMGKAIAMALAGAGYDLGLGARNIEDLTFLSREIQALYPHVEVFTKSVDLSQKYETQNFAETFLHHWGSIDVLVNNVGTYKEDSVESFEEKRFEELMNLNFMSALRLTQMFVPEFTKNKSGHIINICSVLSKEVRRNALSYTLSKQALYTYSRILREELRESNVRVTAILPGSTNTSSWEGIDAPVQDFVQPKDVSSAVLLALESTGLVEEIEIKPLDSSL